VVLFILDGSGFSLTTTYSIRRNMKWMGGKDSYD